MKAFVHPTDKDPESLPSLAEDKEWFGIVVALMTDKTNTELEGYIFSPVVSSGMKYGRFGYVYTKMEEKGLIKDGHE